MDTFAKEVLYFGRGEVFLTIKMGNNNEEEFLSIVKTLGFKKRQADDYIAYLERRESIKMIKQKFNKVVPIAAAGHIPKDVGLAEEVAGHAHEIGDGQITKDSLGKAAQMPSGLGSGTSMEQVANSKALLESRADQGEAFNKWIQNEHKYSSEEVIAFSSVFGSGLTEDTFTTLMLEAVSKNYPDWNQFYKKAAKACHPDKGGTTEMMAMLNTMNTAVATLYEKIEFDANKEQFNKLKVHFGEKIYPKMVAERA